jgi:hypothetical protein
VLVALVIPACGTPDEPPEVLVSSGATTLRAARLSGRQEVPPVATPGSGSATVTVNPAMTEATVVVEVSGLSDITEAHIHFGDVGVDGPIIFPLAEGSFTSPLTVTLTIGNFTPQEGVPTFDGAMQALMNGRTYVNVHTAANPDGELRGQVGPATLTALLDGGQETPPVQTGATGTMTVMLNPDQTAATYFLSDSGLLNVTGAHIHVAPPGVAGPIIFPLAEGPYTSPLTATLTEADFTPQPGAATFDEAVDAMLTGNTYANVHTAAYPDGEIRGQILAPMPAPTPEPGTPTIPPSGTPPGGGVTTIPVYRQR